VSPTLGVPVIVAPEAVGAAAAGGVGTLSTALESYESESLATLPLASLINLAFLTDTT